MVLKRGDFYLQYQLSLDLTVEPRRQPRSARSSGGTLARHDLAGRLVSVVEKTNTIAPVNEWVLRKACTDACLLSYDCFVAVSISPIKFMIRDFFGIVARIVEEDGIAPKRLELELTESAMMQKHNSAAEILKKLTARAISITVHDCGIGYSNLILPDRL